MYGLILQNMSEYIKKTFGPGKWKEIKEKMDMTEDDFGIITNTKYSVLFFKEISCYTTKANSINLNQTQ